MNSIDEILIENIIRLRKERGWKQVDLARIAKLDPITLNKMENRKRPVGKATAQKLAKAFGCTVDELYTVPTPAARPSTDLYFEYVRNLERENAELKAAATHLPLEFEEAYRTASEERREAALALLSGNMKRLAKFLQISDDESEEDVG